MKLGGKKTANYTLSRATLSHAVAHVMTFVC